MDDLYLALAASAIVTLLCDAEITERYRLWLLNNQHKIGKVLECSYCTAWWVVPPLAVLTHGINCWQLVRIPALVTGCMAGILLINWAKSTYSTEE